MAGIFRDLTTLATELVSTATDFVVNKTDLEKKLDEALSNANWGASATLLREIANATQHHQDFALISRSIWDAVGQPPSNWRKVYKGLQLLEACVKYGSERCVDDARDHVFRVRTLVDFSLLADGKDAGAGIREVAKRLTEMLADTGRLREERRKAKELSSKFVGISNEGSYGGGGGDEGAWDRPRGVGGSSGGGQGSGRGSASSAAYNDAGDYGVTNSSSGGGGANWPPKGRTMRSGFTSGGGAEQVFSPEVAAPARGGGGGGGGVGPHGRRGRRAAGSFDDEADDIPNPVPPPAGLLAAMQSTSEFDAFGAAPQAEDDGFGSFGAAPAPAPARQAVAARVGLALKPAPAPAPAAADAFDLFGSAPAPAPAPAPTQTAAFDPFGSSFAPAPAPVASDPFGSPEPVQRGASAAPASGGSNNPFAGGFGSPGDSFGAFSAATSAPVPTGRADADVDRLVALNKLNLGQPEAAPVGIKAAPLKSLAPPRAAAPMGAGAMGGSAMSAGGAGASISGLAAGGGVGGFGMMPQQQQYGMPQQQGAQGYGGFPAQAQAGGMGGFGGMQGGGGGMMMAQPQQASNPFAGGPVLGAGAGRAMGAPTQAPAGGRDAFANLF